MKKLSLLLISMMSSFFLTAQTPGTLYNLFGDNGIVLTDYDDNGSNFNYARASVLQSDMKIVLGGYTSHAGTSGTTYNIMVARYNPHGSPDVGFGENGITVLPYGGSKDYLTDIAVQSDGKIVGVGHTTQGNKTQMLAFRLNTDGSLDNSFNSGGTKVIDFGENVNAYGMSLGICDDGKIVISGYVRDSVLNYSEIAMCKLLPSGILDIDFGVFGLISYEWQDLFHFPDELIIHNDRIILGGISLNDDFERFAVFSRYHLNGEIDYSFGNVGYTSVMLNADTFIMGAAMDEGMCLAPDGKILYTCPHVPTKFESDFSFLRLNQNGGIDYSFGTNGILVTPMDENSYANDIITQEDGKIIACGSYNSPDPGGEDFLIMRYLENGDLDTGFGTDGTGIIIINVSSEVQWYEDKSYNAMFCNMDRLLVSGYARTIDGEKDFAMACFHTGLSVDVDTPVSTSQYINIYPNPVQDQARISFMLEQDSQVQAEVVNTNGQTVAVISDNYFPAGKHEIDWNTEKLPTGIYLVKFTANDMVSTSKVIITE